MLCVKKRTLYFKVKISLVLCKLYLAIGYEFMELLESAHSLGIWVDTLLLSY